MDTNPDPNNPNPEPSVSTVQNSGIEAAPPAADPAEPAAEAPAGDQPEPAANPEPIDPQSEYPNEAPPESAEPNPIDNEPAQVEAVADGDEPKLAEPVNEVANAAAAGVSADDIVAASNQPAPADPIETEIAALKLRLAQVEAVLKDHFGFLERIFSHFGGKL